MTEWRNASKVEVLVGTAPLRGAGRLPGMATDENGACPLCGRFLRNANHKPGCPGVAHADEAELMREDVWRCSQKIAADAFNESATADGGKP